MIDIQDVTKVYRMGDVEVRALDGVSLKVEPGDWVAIMGRQCKRIVRIRDGKVVADQKTEVLQ